ncbi:hypothetical protein Syn7502_00719 [Synechococcus sp. PCC 7502]|uniref:hypothetical protein n=1 Tax=Synechococcus sp. PCC 7502 TaxID=1173263 RepID=UPI00029F9462|nr:hypothetical protein [Synechococcus sp. PCC 7502]AFY72858.1 hypothetical protein Syn7502_00719 [Synechococcus sp. PCC 7502]
MQIQELVILTLLSATLQLKYNTPKVEVQIPEKQTIAEDRLKSFSLEEIGKLADTEDAKFCSDSSDIYKKLALKKVDPIFRPCISKLLKMTKVPLIFPSTVPIPSYLKDRKHYAYIDAYGTNTNRYSIGITWGLLERYQTNVAFFSGEKLTSSSPSLAIRFKKSISDLRGLSNLEPRRYEKSYSESGAVSLTKGVDGYYVAGICGANCHGNFSHVSWEQNGYLYTVAIKLGKKKTVIEIANSVINNQT